MTKKKNIQRQLEFATANDILTLKKAFDQLQKLKNGKYMASALTITIKDISGNNIVDEFAIIDGLENPTIEKIQDEIRRTYQIRTSLTKI